MQNIIKQCKQAIEKYYDLEVGEERYEERKEQKTQNIIYLSKQTFRNIERLIKNINININVNEIIENNENNEIYKKIFILF